MGCGYSKIKGFTAPIIRLAINRKGKNVEGDQWATENALHTGDAHGRIRAQQSIWCMRAEALGHSQSSRVCDDTLPGYPVVT